MLNKTTHTEKELLRLAAEGSEAAFTEIFNLYKNKLYSFVLGVTKSEEQSLDFVQDIFMKLWINRASLPAIDNFSSYIFRSAQNQAINSFKRSMTEHCILKKNQVAEMASNSIEADLEYKLVSPMRNLIREDKQILAILQGHGEVGEGIHAGRPPRPRRPVCFPGGRRSKQLA